MIVDQRNWCYKCGALETEPARENCGNPPWHVPPPQPQPQPGACGRCVCDDDDEPVCSCCHTTPCEVT